ncbi:MAG: gamma-glutamyltransferase, partial [Alphaproteobacteria bacterium]
MVVRWYAGGREARGLVRVRQFALACASVALAACAGSSDGPPEPVSEGFYGAAVGDEPRAVLTARDVLTAGGDAVDAAVAYYFAAAVTYPAAASLGAGGACVVYDAEANRAEALEFLPPLTAEAPPGMRAVAVPGLARGLYALHSRYSRLRFEQLVAPAEALARLGHRVSRALAVDIDVAGEALMAEPGMREAFGGRGAGLGEGEDFVQIDLGATLTQIRSRGVGALYTGALARRLVDGASAVGAALDAGALQAFAPVWRATAELEVGYAVAHVPPPPTTAAVSSLAVFAMTVS